MLITITDKENTEHRDFIDIDEHEFDYSESPIHDFLEKISKVSENNMAQFRISFGY